MRTAQEEPGQRVAAYVRFRYEEVVSVCVCRTRFENEFTAPQTPTETAFSCSFTRRFDFKDAVKVLGGDE